MRNKLIVLLLLAAITPITTIAAPPDRAIVEGQILVKPKSGLTRSKMLEILSRSGGAAVGIQQKLDKLGVKIIKVPPGREHEFVQKLRQRPEFEFAEPDYLVAPDEFVPDDPRYGNQWHLPVITAPTAWASAAGTGIIVAVVDTGVDPNHEDLADRVLPGRNIPSSNDNAADIMGHGTAVAGSIAAAGNNGIGIASVAFDARILPVRISDRSDGVASHSDMAAGIMWAADQGARVANLSYGSGGSATVQTAARYLHNLGGLTFVAAGNDGIDPGWVNHPDLIVVGATGKNDALTGFSNYGSFIDLTAPGDYIYSTTRSGGYSNWRGTSFSSPVAAGVAALVMSAAPELGPSQVAAILADTAVDKGAEGRDPEYGDGRVDAGAAIAAAELAFPGDTIDPSGSIANPAEGSVVSGVVPVSVTATDNQSVARVELLINGAIVGSDFDPPYEFIWDTSGSSPGEYTIGANVHDGAQNMASAASVNVVIESATGDDIGPEINFTSPAADATVSGTVNVSAYATDPDGVEMISLKAGGKLLCAGAPSVSCGWNTRKLDAGSYSIDATATDRLGNVSTSAINVTLSKSGSKRGGSNGGGGGGGGKGKGKNR